MATVFMKWLETRPQDYDRGIHLLTLGRLEDLHATILKQWIREGVRVLEIGCGTGALTLAMAEGGAIVTALDLAPAMLAVAEGKVNQAGLEGNVEFKLMDAALMGDHFDAGTFDLVVGSLVLSEMAPDALAYVLKECLALLAPDGKLAIVDEVAPSRLLYRLALGVVRLPLRFITWLLTRTTTHPLRNIRSTLSRAGFDFQVAASHLGGSLQLIIARPAVQLGDDVRPATLRQRLRHRRSLRTLFLDLWAVAFRIVPPYPKVVPGLYAVGEPNPNSPVLVTGNYDLTVRRLVQAIDGRLEAWVLVVDSSGINVWCGAGGGFLTAEKVCGALRMSRLHEIVRHRSLILPQLCANGVDGWRIRQETGWEVRWGPVRAIDIPDYLEAGEVKTEAMRSVRFPLKDRLEMMAATLGFYGLIILIPVAIFWRSMFWTVLISMLVISTFYAVVHPWLPGRDGLAKSLPLALICLAGLVAYSAILDPVPTPRMFNRALGIIALSVFTGAELQGMSPLMRGEQANWGWEAVIGGVLVLTYWLVPIVLGWS
jgi:SAM-dependent methyltransferase